MEEELKELAAAYMAAAKGLESKWPNGLEKIGLKDYRQAVSDLAIASAMEMAAEDIRKIIDRHSDDGK